jgi:hypothetical protein
MPMNCYHKWLIGYKGHLYHEPFTTKVAKSTKTPSFILPASGGGKEVGPFVSLVRSVVKLPVRDPTGIPTYFRSALGNP